MSLSRHLWHQRQHCRFNCHDRFALLFEHVPARIDAGHTVKPPGKSLKTNALVGGLNVALPRYQKILYIQHVISRMATARMCQLVADNLGDRGVRGRTYRSEGSFGDTCAEAGKSRLRRSS